MNQSERRRYLIDALLAEDERFQGLEAPTDAEGQRQLLRALMNVRPPRPVPADVLRVQDDYLQKRLLECGVTNVWDLEPVSFAEPALCVWRGDITTLAADAIVNAANSQMLGCFYPCHGCIDNAIHTYAGMQLRLACAEQMRGASEPTGSARITPGFNLPAAHVIHTVGPIVKGSRPTRRDCQLLASCYQSCLELADARDLTSIAFCCISTGEFCFPRVEAAGIAVRTVREFLFAHAGATTLKRVVFNVFTDEDEEIYHGLL